MIVDYFLFIFSFVSVGFLFFVYKKSNNSRSWIIRQIESDIASLPVNDSLLEKIKKIEEIKRIDLSWYEKLVSVVGVTAFITMSVGTVIQAIEAFKKEKELKVAEEKLHDMQKKESEIDKYMESAANSIIDKFNSHTDISDSEKLIIEWKVKFLINKEHPDLNDVSKIFNILLATKQYELAKKVVEKNTEIINSSSIYDRVTMAEYYYLIDDTIMLKKALLGTDKTSIPPAISLRFFSLLWLVNNKESIYVNDLSRKLKLTSQETKNRIIKHIDHLQESKSCR